MGGNQALQANPDNGLYTGTSDINITTHGSDWYFAVTAVMFASTIAFIGLSFTVPRRNRIFHYITAAITMTASVAYFTMGSNLGYTPIAVEFQRNNSVVRGTVREIFYVRYIDWFVTTPVSQASFPLSQSKSNLESKLLLLDLLLTAGLPWPTILWTIFLDEVMIITGLVGALVASTYKWGYFTFAMVALFAIAWNVVIVARSNAKALGPTISKTFLLCGVWTIFLWFLYPIAWGLSEGGNVISPDSEAVFYGVLDILAKPVFGALLIFGHRNIDPAQLGLHIRDYDDMPSEKAGYGNNGIAGDVPVTGAGTTGVSHGATHGTTETAAGVHAHNVTGETAV